MEKILVVDRDELKCQLFAGELTKEGYSVRCLHDGFRALREIAVNPPDMVIVEAVLPGISGIELVLKVKSSNPGLPVIIHTDWHLCRENYLAWIADEVLVKTDGTDRLVSTVRRLLAWSKRPWFGCTK